jgi:monovalent cation/proton antiporter MnhG/PhaG subunit
MSALREILAVLLLLGGASVVALAALGVARLPDPFSRMHAAAKAGVAGAGLLLLGAGLAFGTMAAMLTVLAAVIFLVLTAPLASHALGRAAYVAGAPLGAASVADALANVLDRRVLDIDPARTLRPRSKPFTRSGEEPFMSGIPEFRRPADPALRDAPISAPVALRRLICCLVGGPNQPEATAQAFDLAEHCGGSMTGLSGAGLEPRLWQGPLPIGGAYWADWLASRSRMRIRENCAIALKDFRNMAAATTSIEVATRHEEGHAADLVRALAGHDLVVLPAGMGPHGVECSPSEEIAASLARARLVPVLRIRRMVAEVRSVLIVVGSQPACGMLATGLLRTGFWPNAEITILPVADHRADIAALVEAQAEILHAAGRKLRILPPLEPDFDLAALCSRLATFDAAVLSCLSTLQGGLFDIVRNCPYEAVSDTVPVVLLP